MAGELRIDRVTKRFGGNVVLKEASLAAAAGAVTALIGPNGAGKSTLANIVSGFTPATSGGVTLDGRDIIGLPIRQRAALGLGRTFQNLEVFVGLTVEENVMMGAYQSGRSGYLSAMLGHRGVRREERRMRDHARSLLDDWGLGGVAHRLVEELSFGEAKLVELARVLAMDPEVVIMDEPAAGLPPSAAKDVGANIARLSQEGITVLLIEHNMQLVMGVADHLVVLDHGEVIAEGVPDTVRADDRVIEAYLGRGAIKPSDQASTPRRSLVGEDHSA